MSVVTSRGTVWALLRERAAGSCASAVAAAEPSERNRSRGCPEMKERKGDDILGVGALPECESVRVLQLRTISGTTTASCHLSVTPGTKARKSNESLLQTSQIKSFPGLREVFCFEDKILSRKISSGHPQNLRNLFKGLCIDEWEAHSVSPLIYPSLWHVHSQIEKNETFRTPRIWRSREYKKDELKFQVHLSGKRMAWRREWKWET